MTEVYLNGEKVDLEEEEVIAATYGNISFGEFSKKKGITTNSFKLPKSNKNKLIIENPDIVQNNSELPYKYFNWHVTIFGVQVISGYAYIVSAKDKYEFQTISGISEFYSIISARSLPELDLSEYTHLWNKPNITGSWTNTEGYIYAYVPYGLSWENYRVHPNYLLPQIYFHTVVRKIVEEAGYKIKGKVLTDLRYLSQVIIYNQFPTSATFEALISLEDGLPNVPQSKVIMDFMNIYGLMASINNDTLEITFDYIDDILFKEPIDWSDKVDDSEDPEVTFDLEYFVESYLSFKTDDLQIEARAKTIAINSDISEKEGFIYQSDFFVPNNHYNEDLFQPYNAGNTTNSWVIKEGQGALMSIYHPDISYGFPAKTIHNGTYYATLKSIPNDAPVTPGTESEFWKQVLPKDIFTYKSRPMYGTVENIVGYPVKIGFVDGDISVIKVVIGENLDWNITYDRHFRVFDMIIQKTKIVELLMKLNYADINQLDFTRPYWLDKFKARFVLEEVNQYKLSEMDSTYCRFIRI